MSANVFYKTRWSEVEKGDTVLVANNAFGCVVELRVAAIWTDLRDSDGARFVVVNYDVGEQRLRDRFDPDAPAYIQSTL